MSQPLPLSQSGLFKITIRPIKIEAKLLQDWVTRIVLPAINKNGRYVAGEKKLKTGELQKNNEILENLH